MRQYSTAYTIGFAAAVCGVCSIFVAGSAVLLKPRQVDNKIFDRQLKVLQVAGLVGEDEDLSRETARQRYAQSIEPQVIELATGDVAESMDPRTFDQAQAAKDPAQSMAAPENEARVRRLPKYATVYKVIKDGKLDSVILPVEGKGLWSTLYGFLALGPDGNTVKGIVFYEHGETPGLGGEVENPLWRSRWPGRKVYDAEDTPVLSVAKGQAGTPEADPHQVDGLSGATLTSRGVTSLVQFWLGKNGFLPYVKKLRGPQLGAAGGAEAPKGASL